MYRLDNKGSVTIIDSVYILAGYIGTQHIM